MRERLWRNPTFVRLLFANFFFFAAFNMLIAEFPAHITRMGGGDRKGYIIGLFTITAMFSRPFSGVLTDRLGRVPVMVFGAVMSCICCFFYSFEFGLGFFFLLRLLHGFSAGFTPTGITAYLDDMIGSERRAEAIGLVGMAGTLGMAMGPYYGSAIADSFGMLTLFYVSCFVAMIAIALIAAFKESLLGKRRFSYTMLKIRGEDILHKNSVLPALTYLFLSVNFGIMLTIIPDYTVMLGLKNKGIFMLVFTITSFCVRAFSGRLADTLSRHIVILYSSFFMIASTLLLAITFDVTFFFVASILMGISNGLYSPVIYAWAIDLAKFETKGRSLSTVFIALELGIGFGAFVSGAILNNSNGNFLPVYIGAAILSSVATIIILYMKLSKHPSLR